MSKYFHSGIINYRAQCSSKGNEVQATCAIKIRFPSKNYLKKYDISNLKVQSSNYPQIDQSERLKSPKES
jgi:hypothetical protein